MSLRLHPLRFVLYPKLTYAPSLRAENFESDEAMLEIIVTRAREQGTAVDPNYQQRPRTLKWWLIGKVFQLAVRAGLANSDLAMMMAHTEGSTALHYASQQVGPRVIFPEGMPEHRPVQSWA